MVEIWGIPLLFHFVAFGVDMYALAWDVINLKDENGESLVYYRGYPGKLKYLTLWCHVLQTIYFGIAALNDVFGSDVGPDDDGDRRSFLQKVRDIILTGMAFPMGLFVTVTFWGLYVVDRELVFPKELDKIIPSWLNHVMHTTVVLFLFIEVLLVYHRYPTRKTGLSLCLGFAGVYQIWIFWIAFYANIWVYPVLAVLSWPGRIAFCAGLWVFVIGVYLIGEGFNKKLWGTHMKTKVKKIA